MPALFASLVEGLQLEADGAAARAGAALGGVVEPFPFDIGSPATPAARAASGWSWTWPQRAALAGSRAPSATDRLAGASGRSPAASRATSSCGRRLGRSRSSLAAFSAACFFGTAATGACRPACLPRLDADRVANLVRARGNGSQRETGFARGTTRGSLPRPAAPGDPALTGWRRERGGLASPFNVALVVDFLVRVTVVVLMIGRRTLSDPSLVGAVNRMSAQLSSAHADTGVGMLTTAAVPRGAWGRAVSLRPPLPRRHAWRDRGSRSGSCMQQRALAFPSA